MAESVGQIGLDLVVNQNGFNRQMSGLQGVAKKAGAALADAFGAKKLVEFGKSCLELGSDLAEVQNVVDVAFPSMNEKINEFAQNAVKQFGLSETMAKRYSGTFGAMAKAFGFSEAEAAAMSTALTGLAGDVASFYNISQDEAYTKLKSVFTGETETLKDLGVVMTQTALDAYALENGFGKTTSAMSEAEKVALRYQFVQSKLSDVQGDFSRTSGSWANQVRILTLQFESLKAVIGQGLIRAFTPAIQAVNELLSRVLTLANALSSVFGGGAAVKETVSNTKALAESTEEITAGFNNANASATNLGKATDSAAKKAKAAAKKVRSLMGFDQVNKVSEESSSSSEGGDSGGGGAGGTASYDFDIDSKPLDEAAEKSIKLGKAFDNVKQAVKKLQKSFGAFVDLMKSGAKWVYDNILVPLGKWTINKLAPKLIEALAAAFDVLTAMGNALKPLWQWLWDNLFSKIAKFAGDAIIKFLDLLIKGLNGLADWIGKHQGAVQVLAASFIGLTAAIKGVEFLSMIQQLGGAGKAFETLVKAINAATLAKIKDKAETLYLNALYAKDFVVNIAKSTAALAKQAAQLIANQAAMIAHKVAQVAMTAATAAWNMYVQRQRLLRLPWEQPLLF